MDEQWSFVAKKKNQRWLWYAWEPRYKRVIAHAFGKRDTDTFNELQRLLSKFTIPFYCTDDYSVLLILETLLSDEALEGVHLVFGFKIHELVSEMLNKLEVSHLESISFCDDKVIYPTAS